MDISMFIVLPDLTQQPSDQRLAVNVDQAFREPAKPVTHAFANSGKKNKIAHGRQAGSVKVIISIKFQQRVTCRFWRMRQRWIFAVCKK